MNVRETQLVAFLHMPQTKQGIEPAMEECALDWKQTRLFSLPADALCPVPSQLGQNICFLCLEKYLESKYLILNLKLPQMHYFLLEHD